MFSQTWLFARYRLDKLKSPEKVNWPNFLSGVFCTDSCYVVNKGISVTNDDAEC